MEDGDVIRRKQRAPGRRRSTEAAAQSALGTEPVSAPITPPVPWNGFIGRERELAQLSETLKSSRVTVLTGPSGVGKTRLARELGVRIADRYRDGVHLAELAALTDPALVPHAVARAMGVWEQPGRSVTEALTGALRRRRLLLILDNCEHLIQACAELAGTLLKQCPKLTILATSQEPLGIGGEQLSPVPPMSVPEAESGHDQLIASEAVALFAARAVSYKPNFVLSSEMVPVVAEICRRLDGVPLAIELAASRVTVLALPQIAARIADRFALLTRGSRAVLPRHQSLSLALGWSHGLLSGPEQTLFRRLSVFAGGFDREAAAAVDGRNDQTLALLNGLVAKSLVIADNRGEESRHRMLQSIRAYAADRLEGSAELNKVKDRHARWCVALAEAAEPCLTGSDQLAWFDRLDIEQDNLRTGFGWLTDRGEAQAALRLAGALTVYWRVRCHFREGYDWLTTALAMDSAVPPSAATRAKALWGAGFMAGMLGDHAAAAPALEASLAIFRTLNDPGGEARALLLLGDFGASSGGGPDPVALFEASADLARQHPTAGALPMPLACSARPISREARRPARQPIWTNVFRLRAARAIPRVCGSAWHCAGTWPVRRPSLCSRRPPWPRRWRSAGN